MGVDPLYIVESDTSLLDYAKSEHSDGQCQFFDDAVLFRDGLASEIIHCARFGTAPPIGVLEHTSDCPDFSSMLDFKTHETQAHSGTMLYHNGKTNRLNCLHRHRPYVLSNAANQHTGDDTSECIERPHLRVRYQRVHGHGL